MRIYYAIEIESGGTYDSTTYGATYGYFRFVTDRPTYAGSDTGGVIPVGDNSAIKINLSGLETLSVALQSGQIYAASNGTFKTADTVLDVGARFTVLDNSDFTGNILAAAKGSAPAEGDMFEVTNNGSGTEAVKYVGKNRWFKEFITRDGLGAASRSVDLEGTGDYGTLSGFSFSIDNTIIAGTDTPFWKNLNDNSVYLANKTVRVYAVLDDVFYQLWTGVIDSLPMNELDLQFSCSPNFKAIHRDIPPVDMTSDTYPDISETADGKPKPICIGDIEYAKISTISDDATFIDLVSPPGFPTSKLVQATAYTAGSFINLYTLGKTFTVNQLLGYYLYVDNGDDTSSGEPDKENGIYILGNLATSLEITTVVIAEPITNFVLAEAGYGGTLGIRGAWHFKIGNRLSSGVVSNSAITSFKTNTDGQLALSKYDTSDKKYKPLPFMVNSSSAALATIDLSPPAITTTGDYEFKRRIPFTISEFLKIGDFTTTWTGTQADIIDFNRATYMKHQIANPTGSGISFYLTIDPKAIEELENIYFGFDITTNANGSAFKTFISSSHRDEYGREGANLMSTDYDNGNGNGFIRNLLPNYYYTGGSNGEVSLFESLKSGVTLSKPLIDKLKLGEPIKFELLFYTSDPGGSSVEGYIKQFGLWGTSSVNITDDTYAKVSGEKISGVNANTVYKALRLITETYDEIPTSKLDWGNLATIRDAWYLGRQLTERKNSFDYIKEICQHAFVCAFQGRTGKLTFSAWRDRTDTPLTHNAAAIIRDSITTWEPTSIDRIFNTFTVNYSYDPGANSFFSSYQIKDVDDSGARPSGHIGLLWDICRAAYLQYNAIKEHKAELPFYVDRERWYNATDTMAGIGIDSSAYVYLENCVVHLTRQKRNTEYRLPMSAANVLACELCTPVAFTDAAYSNGSAISGHIHTVEYDLKANQIVIGALLDPLDNIDELYTTYIETGNADTITESGSQPDTITEDGNNG